jgi:predicted RNA binding protein YcfA (HicA-like mRNA interferase family)
MNKADKLKAKVLSGKGYHNFSFSDLAVLLAGLGFVLDRQESSHQVWKHPAVPTLVNVQSVKGKAKPYQLRQLREIIKEHRL